MLREIDNKTSKARELYCDTLDIRGKSSVRVLENINDASIIVDNIYVKSSNDDAKFSIIKSGNIIYDSVKSVPKETVKFESENMVIGNGDTLDIDINTISSSYDNNGSITNQNNIDIKYPIDLNNIKYGSYYNPSTTTSWNSGMRMSTSYMPYYKTEDGDEIVMWTANHSSSHNSYQIGHLFYNGIAIENNTNGNYYSNNVGQNQIYTIGQQFIERDNLIYCIHHVDDMEYNTSNQYEAGTGFYVYVVDKRSKTVVWDAYYQTVNTSTAHYSYSTSSYGYLNSAELSKNGEYLAVTCEGANHNMYQYVIQFDPSGNYMTRWNTSSSTSSTDYSGNNVFELSDGRFVFLHLRTQSDGIYYKTFDMNTKSFSGDSILDGTSTQFTLYNTRISALQREDGTILIATSQSPTVFVYDTSFDLVTVFSVSNNVAKLIPYGNNSEKILAIGSNVDDLLETIDTDNTVSALDLTVRSFTNNTGTSYWHYYNSYREALITCSNYQHSYAKVTNNVVIKIDGVEVLDD
jgi:hypothetical protein